MYKNFTKSKEWSILKCIISILICVSELVYLTIGFFCKTWHPSWLIFVICAILITITYLVLLKMYGKSDKFKDNAKSFDKQFEESKNYAKSVKFSGVLFMVMVVIYILWASFSGLWHPLWLLFLVMIIIDEIKACCTKIKFKDYKKDLIEEIGEEDNKQS